MKVNNGWSIRMWVKATILTVVTCVAMGFEIWAFPRVFDILTYFPQYAQSLAKSGEWSKEYASRFIWNL